MRASANRPHPSDIAVRWESLSVTPAIMRTGGDLQKAGTLVGALPRNKTRIIWL